MPLTLPIYKFLKIIFRITLPDCINNRSRMGSDKGHFKCEGSYYDSIVFSGSNAAFSINSWVLSTRLKNYSIRVIWEDPFLPLWSFDNAFYKNFVSFTRGHFCYPFIFIKPNILKTHFTWVKKSSVDSQFFSLWRHCDKSFKSK